MAKICLITPGQPSTNPRLVKEADALFDAGYVVQVICAHWATWADEADRGLLASRFWQCTYVGGHPLIEPWTYRWSRLRHGLARRFAAKGYGHRLLREVACARVLPELTRAAKATHADLYIAHNLAALPAAVSAARKYRVNVGFDAEDFHSGMGEGTQVTALIEGIERTYLPQCDYLTAGSPQIAEAYAEKYRVVTPISILNVFPLEERPSKFRPSVRGALKLYWFSQTIGARRGLEDVIKAIGLLPECHIELHLRGEWQSGYQETLYELARSIGVASEKIIAHSPAPANEMVRLASEYEIGLGTEVTSEQNRNICLTNKVFTYLLAGNAVIATATKAQQTFVETIGEAGFCYDPGDVRALAEQLNHWHHNHNALESARRQAWKCGTELYNWDVEKHKFLAVVNNVLNRRSPI